MKRTAVVLVLAALLLVGMTQVGFAAVEETGTRFAERCREIWADLSPEQREQAEEARDEFRAQMEALREEYRAKKDALREEFLSQLPEEAREALQERMAAREQRREDGRNGHGCRRGFGD